MIERSETNALYGWHTVLRTGRTKFGKCRPRPGGKEYFRGRPILCEQGLHFAPPGDAILHYLYGPILRRVRCYGKWVFYDDKCVAQHRDELWRVNIIKEVIKLYIIIHGNRLERLLKKMKTQKKHEAALKNINNIHELFSSGIETLSAVRDTFGNVGYYHTPKGALLVALNITLAARELRAIDSYYFYPFIRDVILPYVNTTPPSIEEFLLGFDPRKKDGDKSKWDIRILK